MDIIRAKNIVRDLAEGIDPRTGEFLPPDTIYNSPEVIRALFTLLEWTDSCIAQDPLRNAGKPWSDVEDDKLRDEFLSRFKTADIAKEHGRSCGAIESRLEHLGLKRKPFWRFGKKNP